MNPDARPPQQHGLLVVNKPEGPTSAGCLERIKRSLGQKKIGHAGTLDPMATGVLLVLLGQGTKIAQYLLEGSKVYSGEMLLGQATDTYDREGEVIHQSPLDGVAENDVRTAVLDWVNMRTQIVPPYSAVKHQGKPLYKIAREGKEPPVKEKPVSIIRSEVLETNLPRVRFRVECGAGAYVRSLVHSLGMRLGCGATLTELTREYSHPFGLDQAHDLDQVLSEPELLEQRVLPLSDALPHWPRLTLTPDQAGKVKNGGRLDYGPLLAPEAGFSMESMGERAVFQTPEGEPLALVETQLKDGRPVWAILRGLWSS